MADDYWLVSPYASAECFVYVIQDPLQSCRDEDFPDRGFGSG